MKEEIKQLIETLLGCSVQAITQVSDDVYSAICKLPGGTVETFRCEVNGNELAIDTW